MMLLHRNLSLGAEMMVLVVILPMMLLHRHPLKTRQPTNQPKSPHPSPPRSQPRSPHLSLRAEMMTPILPMMLLHRNLSLGAEMMVLVVILPMMLLHRHPLKTRQPTNQP